MSDPKSHSPAPWSWGAGAGKWVLTDANGKPMVSFSEWSIEPLDMPLIAAAPDMLKLLRELEWSGGDVSGGGCPECGDCHSGKKHLPDCELAALLDRLGRG